MIQKVHITHREVAKHLAALKGKGLVVERADGRKLLYFATDKGQRYLELYHKMKELLTEKST